MGRKVISAPQQQHSLVQWEWCDQTHVARLVRERERERERNRERERREREIERERERGERKREREREREQKERERRERDKKREKREKREERERESEREREGGESTLSLMNCSPWRKSQGSQNEIQTFNKFSSIYTRPKREIMQQTMNGFTMVKIVSHLL
jgi:hypothetical protein